MTLGYEGKETQQVLYVVPITSIVRRLALVPVGDTGTIPYLHCHSTLVPHVTQGIKQAMEAGGGMSTLGQQHCHYDRI